MFDGICLADSRALQNFCCSVKPKRHTATGLLAPSVTSGGHLMPGLELKHKFCLGEPTRFCRLVMWIIIPEHRAVRCQQCTLSAPDQNAELRLEIPHSVGRDARREQGSVQDIRSGRGARRQRRANLGVPPAGVCWEAPPARGRAHGCCLPGQGRLAGPISLFFTGRTQK